VLETASLWGVNGMRKRILVSAHLPLSYRAPNTDFSVIQRILPCHLLRHVPACLETAVFHLLFPRRLAVICSEDSFGTALVPGF
jgi:hypothetical protein